MGFAVPGFTQQAAEQVEALDLFFQLGLPDAKTAKWVNAQGPVYAAPLFAERSWGSSGDESGNAWVLREEKGVVDLLFTDGSQIRAKVGSEGAPTESAGLPQAMVKSADWKKDAAAFSERLKKAAGKPPSTRSEIDFDRGESTRDCGPGLLFIAQARRRGDEALAREALPLILKVAGSPSAALDQAIGTIADQRMRALANEWQSGKDAPTYIADVEALIARFTRGWKNRPAAQQLITRLKQPRVAGENDPEARAVAEMLLTLKPNEIAGIPPRQAWLLPASEGDAEAGQAVQRHIRVRSSRRIFQGMDSGTAASGSRVPPQVTKFFADPRRAARSLARLLDDERMLRVTKGSDNGMGYSTGYSYSMMHDDSPEESVRKSYETIARPKELGELCWGILGGVLPDKIQSRMSSRQQAAPAVLEWLLRVEKMSDDDLAWEYLRGSDRTSDAQFQTGLSFLVSKGSEESRAKLDEVFRDPAVWAGQPEEIVQALEKHAGSRKGDLAQFGQEVIAAVKKGQEEQRLEQSRYMSGDDAYVKQLERQSAAVVAKVVQVFKPSSITDVLEKLASADDEEAQVILETLQPMLAKVSPAEAEASVLQTAVRVKSPAIKAGLLQPSSSRGFDASERPKNTAPLSAESRAAALKLLNDQTVVPGNNWSMEEQTVAEVAMSMLYAARAPMSAERMGPEDVELMQVFTEAPAVGERWMRARAFALAEGKDLPPAPDGSKVPAGEIDAIVAELSAASSTECARLFASKTFDQQTAVIRKLRQEATAWPESVKQATLTVGQARNGKQKAISTEQWKGRQFDSALLTEIGDAIEKAATDGKGMRLVATFKGTLGGVTLSGTETKQKISPKQMAASGLSLPESGPQPIAVVWCQAGFPEGAYAMYPIWKDPAATKAWRADAEKKVEGNDKEESNVPRRGRKPSAAAVAKAIKAIVDSAPTVRWSPGTIMWGVSPISDSKDSDEIPDQD